ncbi:hypothetical protein KUTeg_006752 [Tegillarca granosa]|uniref:Major facilitator superfamily (MFS) profile domain-containing protein n=1 Tax=Tegillarca granosa TaxID=220873 RepID=A0ABQ9FB87_TEGGR|nr:hypothetical protein KUTeg_006752 [Tegillarca granosa]
MAWSPNIYVFSVIHFLTGFSGIAYFSIAVISVLELVGPTKRTMAGLVIEMVWSVGMMILCTVAYFIRNWRHLQIAVSAPSFVLLFYWMFIPESPRWLLAKGRKNDALQILKKMALVNKTELPDKLGDIECETRLGFKEVVFALLRLVTAMAYFGLTYNVGRIAGDLYANFLLTTVVEFMGYMLCLILSSKCGRKPVMVGSLVLAGLAVIVSVVYISASQWATVALSMIGKCGVSASFGNVFVYTPELFPTNVRSFVTGSCNTGARIGTLISPYIVNIADFVPGHFGTSIAYIIFGGCTVSIGLTCMILPETLNSYLPETLEEAVNLQRRFPITVSLDFI